MRPWFLTAGDQERPEASADRGQDNIVDGPVKLLFDRLNVGQ
jgi:hypothetical protein